MGLGNAVNVALSSLQSLTGTAVRYTRGEHFTDLIAVPGRTQYETLTEEGYNTLAQSRDYIVRVSELILNGCLITPERGDKITETVNGVALTYEALPLTGEVYSYLDQYRTAYRIHTKQVG